MATAIGWRLAGFAAVVVAATAMFIFTIELFLADGPHPIWYLFERFGPVARVMLLLTVPGFVLALVLIEIRHWREIWAHVSLGAGLGLATGLAMLGLILPGWRLDADMIQGVLLAAMVGAAVGAGSGAAYWLVTVWLRASVERGAGETVS
jgi:hypothetical protein